MKYFYFIRYIFDTYLVGHNLKFHIAEIAH